jgi:hypothetical protein
VSAVFVAGATGAIDGWTLYGAGEMRDAAKSAIEAHPDPAPLCRQGEIRRRLSLGRLSSHSRRALKIFGRSLLEKHRMARLARRGAPWIHFCGLAAVGVRLETKLNQRADGGVGRRV